MGVRYGRLAQSRTRLSHTGVRHSRVKMTVSSTDVFHARVDKSVLPTVEGHGHALKYTGV